MHRHAIEENLVNNILMNRVTKRELGLLRPKGTSKSTACFFFFFFLSLPKIHSFVFCSENTDSNLFYSFHAALCRNDFAYFHK